MSWKNGPMPSETYGYGGVVKCDEDPKLGFHFADFRGDHVLLVPSGERVEPRMIAQFANNLELPAR